MRWTVEELANHPRRNHLLGISEPAPSPEPVRPPEPVREPVREPASEPGIACFRFTVPGAVMGKPRMTQRDRWAKRPNVLRYREFCDRIREYAGTLPADVFGVHAVCYIPMPASWSQAKKSRHYGTLMRQKPDGDNIVKAVMDALLDRDEGVGCVGCIKLWCTDEEAQMHVRLFHA